MDIKCCDCGKYFTKTHNQKRCKACYESLCQDDPFEEYKKKQVPYHRHRTLTKYLECWRCKPEGHKLFKYIQDHSEKI